MKTENRKTMENNKTKKENNAENQKLGQSYKENSQKDIKEK